MATTTWTSAQVLALAPDDSSIKSGKSLASAGKWQNLGASDQAIWGECQGSGKNPYQSSINLSETAFKCSCPSRKFPCKHGLGLFLLYAEKPELFPASISPAWVTEWLFKREQSATKKTEKQKATIDPAAQAQRQAKREQKIAAGLGELDRWLQDLVGQGLAEMPAKSYDFWDGMAARMVDAQAPGLARRLKEAAGIAHSGDPNWVATLLTELGKLHLLVRGYDRLGSLPSGLRSEVRTQVGWTISQDELIDLAAQGEAETVEGDWLVLGQTVTEEDGGLRAHRIWLWGQERFALILNFVYRQAPLDLSWKSGTVVAAKLIFYPSSATMRAIAIDHAVSPLEYRYDSAGPLLTGDSGSQPSPPSPSPSSDRQSLVGNISLFLYGVIPYRQDQDWWIVDRAGITVPLNIKERSGWQLAALSGGIPIALTGIWNSRSLKPLGVWIDNNYCAIP